MFDKLNKIEKEFFEMGRTSFFEKNTFKKWKEVEKEAAKKAKRKKIKKDIWNYMG